MERMYWRSLGWVLTPEVDSAQFQQPCETVHVMSTQQIFMRCSIMSKRADMGVTLNMRLNWLSPVGIPPCARGMGYETA